MLRLVCFLLAGLASPAAWARPPSLVPPPSFGSFGSFGSFDQGAAAAPSSSKTTSAFTLAQRPPEAKKREGRGDDAPPYFRYGAGLRGGLLFIPEWFLTGLFFDEAEGVTSGGFAAEFLLRTSETFEYSFAFGWHSISFGGNDAQGLPLPNVFLNKGSNADQREFVVNTLSYLSLDVRFIKLFPVHRYVHLLIGGGIGLGILLGRIIRTDTTIPGYTGQDGPYKEEYRLWKQDKTKNPLSNRACETAFDGRDCKLNKTLSEDKGIKNHGSNEIPEGRLEDRVPPVIPILDAFFGLSFPVHERLTIRLQTGIGLPRLFWLELGVHANF